jgi:MoaA/NifB/PqqE/SkfB family radical SAM enzyme
MPFYRNPEPDLLTGLARCYIASKSGGLVLPHAMDIHPVSGRCNLDCRWCIGRFQRTQIDPLPDRLQGGGLLQALQKTLDPRWSYLWPSEFHICGCDSEPLLSQEVLPAIEFLRERNRVTELITNGLLLGDSHAMVAAVARIQKLSVSLDVANAADYREYKLPRESATENAFGQVVTNIERVASYRRSHSSGLRISVTFVATPVTYDRNRWQELFVRLADIGVDDIRVRDDLNETFGPPVRGLHNDVRRFDKLIPNVRTRFISPDEPYSSFEYCRASRLWPALAADGCLYPCAHTASSAFRPFGNLLQSSSLLDLYRDRFQTHQQSFLRADEIECDRKCPSVLGRYNEPALACHTPLGQAFI